VNRRSNPLVVQYLYVHGQDEAFFYPSARSASSVAAVAARYLECALVQAASLAFQNADCELALATNVTDPRTLGGTGAELLKQIESLGVAILPTEYRHRPANDDAHYISSRYVLDAILTASEGQPEDRPLFLTDLDCVWVTPQRLFDAVPEPPEVGCIYISYPPDWDAVGAGDAGRTRRKMGTLAKRMASSTQDPRDIEELPPWVGGELLAGTAAALRQLVAACEELDAATIASGDVLLTEEQVLSLAGALGRVRFRELSKVAWRIHTGPRHEAHAIEDPLSLGLWHLPSEKGLSLRRAAHALRRGHTRALGRDFSDPARMARRFNVAGTGIGRRIRDDGWIAGRRISAATRARLDAIRKRA